MEFLGESEADTGGPRRELFSLIVQQMKGVFLEGKEDSMVFIHNAPFVKVSM